MTTADQTVKNEPETTTTQQPKNGQEEMIIDLGGEVDFVDKLFEYLGYAAALGLALMAMYVSPEGFIIGVVALATFVGMIWLVVDYVDRHPRQLTELPEPPEGVVEVDQEVEWKGDKAIQWIVMGGVGLLGLGGVAYSLFFLPELILAYGLGALATAGVLKGVLGVVAKREENTVEVSAEFIFTSTMLSQLCLRAELANPQDSADTAMSAERRWFTEGIQASRDPRGFYLLEAFEEVRWSSWLPGENKQLNTILAEVGQEEGDEDL